MKRARKLFITGIFVLTPLVVTISIISWFVLKIDTFFQKPVRAITGESFIGLGLILTIGLIFITGFLATNFVGKRIIHNIENTILKIPIANVIYTTIKQLRDTVFNNKKKKAFKSVVLIEYPSKGIYTLGFITGKAPVIIEDVTKKKMASIFVPTTPNPTSGMFIMVPLSDLVNLEISVDTAIKLIVSGGVLTPDFSSKLDHYENEKFSQSQEEGE